MYSFSGLGATRLPVLGYNFFSGGPNYYPDDSTVFSTDLPSNCQGAGDSAKPSNLPPDGERCFMAEFPFVGTKYYGCASMTAQGGYGAPYVGCEPVILKGGGFDFISPLLRLGATALTGWLVLRFVRD